MDLYKISLGEKIKYRWLNFRKWLFCPLAKKNNWRWLFNVCNCQRYEPKWVWLWICPDCRKVVKEDKPGAIYQKFTQGQEPTESCDCAIIPPIVETVTRKVCIRSGELVRSFCLHTEVREYEKGLEPTKQCTIHNYRKSGRRKEMCGGALGFFLWFIRVAWKKANQMMAEELAMETFAEWAKRDVTYLDWFVFLCDNKAEHKFLNDKTPFVQYISKILKKRMFKLSQKNPRFFELLDRFIFMHSLFDISPAPQVFMDRYNYYPFENNDEGVKGFWTDAAFPYQKLLTKWVVEVCKKHFGENFLLKFINEPRHREGKNADEKFHRIAIFHRDLADQVLIPIMSSKESAYSMIITDNSESEAGQLLIVWHGRHAPICPKCKKLLSELFPTRLTEEWMGRLRDGEQHSVNFISDFEKGYNSLIAFFKSANIKSRWHGDGSDDCEQAKGYRIGNFCFASAKQYEETCDFAWKKQVEHNKSRGRKKTVFMVPFNAETLHKVDGVFLECWEKTDVDWSIIDGMHRAHKKNFG